MRVPRNVLFSAALLCGALASTAGSAPGTKSASGPGARGAGSPPETASGPRQQDSDPQQRPAAEKARPAATPRRRPAVQSAPARAASAPAPSRPDKPAADHPAAASSRDWQKQKGWRRGGGWQGAPDWKRSRARHWESEHRDWNQRGGYGGYRIPEAQFAARFGAGRNFHLRRAPVFYGGYPRFSYGGFSFLILDPWPEYWAENWYAEDTYIVWNEGYYLYSRRQPTIGISITVYQ